MQKTARYPKKVMLVGEYGLLAGGSALSWQAGETNHFMADGTIQKVDFQPSNIQGGYRFFLLDTGERFDTETLEKQFISQMEDKDFASSVRNEYMVINQKLIEVLLETREADPALLVRAISDFQFTHFRKMIPDTALDPWIEGQVSNDYYLKLSGPGSGFMLGIAHGNMKDSLEERWGELISWIG
ncbi:MAG: hypothetical protein ABFS10_06960 [Bacteroidota bacterium]